MAHFLKTSFVFLIVTVPVWATTYYIAPAYASPAGSDSNDGLFAATPWLTPNHAVNCGDVILAAAGTYVNTNFSFAHWGTVSCPTGNNVAWLKCATFATCSITASTAGSYYHAIGIDKSYWGVQGWVLSATADTNACVSVYPYGLMQLHHIVIANNVCNGAYFAGISVGNNNGATVSSPVQCGAYNGTATCSLSGTTTGHMLVAWTSSLGNTASVRTPSGCVTWTQIGPSSGEYDAWWTGSESTGGACNVTSSSAGTAWVAIAVWDTVNVSNTADGTPAGALEKNSGGVITGPSVTTANPGDMVFAACFVGGNYAVNANSWFSDDLHGNMSGVQGYAGQGHYGEIAAGPIAPVWTAAASSANCGTMALKTSLNVGTDYLAIIGNAVYDAARSSLTCQSGIDVQMPVAYDSLPGTHMYIAGNFTWGNVEPNPCHSQNPSDGQGIFFDTVQPYNGQIVIENNISAFNGGWGIKTYLNNGTTGPNAKIYFRHNTLYGNQTGGISNLTCAELGFQSTVSAEAYLNLVQTNAATGCRPSSKLYVLGVSSADGTSTIHDNYGYSATGSNTVGAGGGFSFGPNNTFTNPNFANPVNPGAPSCSGASSVPNCMATMIANFTPTTAAAKPYGYQIPSSASIYDPLFPQWLCSVTNFPAGLVTMGCLTGSS